MKAMKRMLTWSLALCLILGLLAGCGQTGTETPEATETPEPVQEEAEEPAGAAEAETEEPVQEEQTLTVYVTISDAGVLKVAQEPVAVTDGDGDGALTVHDALLAAHDALYQGGAEAGLRHRHRGLRAVYHQALGHGKTAGAMAIALTMPPA